LWKGEQLADTSFIWYFHTITTMCEPKSTLYTHCTIITINPAREVILDGYLLVTGPRITSIGKNNSLPVLPSNATVISLQNRIVIPGLINTHAHLAQSLLRGLAEDLPLHSWLCDVIWPLEASYADEDGYVAAKLTIAEMLKSGTTCFLEAMLTHRSGFENVVRAVGESGIRGCLVSVPAKQKNMHVLTKIRES
jgi:cytosine/adenosine deaminase-related metal-dependent hydrolase